MIKHAESQVDDLETVRLIQATLRSADHAGSMRLVEALAISGSEMLGRWSIQTPEGPLFRVAILRVVDGEAMGFDASYRDEADALAVWEHLVEEVRNR